MLQRPWLKANIERAIKSPVVALFARRSSFTITHSNPGIRQQAQQRREMLVDIPAGRDGDIELAPSQFPPIQANRRKQIQQAFRQPVASARPPAKNLIDVRIRYQHRPVGLLGNDGQMGAGEIAFQFAK